MPRTPSPTRTKILETTRTLFSSHGFDNTTIDDIITASGVTKGAFYHYFKSKEALCQTVIQQSMRDYQALVESLPSTGPYERLTQLITKILQLNSSGEWVNCRLMLRLLTEPHDEAPSVQYELNTFWQWYKGLFFDLVIKSRQEGRIRTDMDVNLQTSLVLSAMWGTCAMTQIEQANQPASDLSAQVLKLLT